MSGLDWLSAFNTGEAKVGYVTQFTGGRGRVSRRRAGFPELEHVETDASSLLALAELAAKLPESSEQTTREKEAVHA